MTSLRVLDVCVLFLWLIIDGVVVFGRHARAATRADRFSTLGIMLASCVGIGVAISLGFAGVGALGACTVPVQMSGLALLAAGIVIRRIHVEERALLESLGDEYSAYCKRTYRLIPGVY